MSLPLVVTPEAESDLDEARTWYDQQGAGLGDQFLEAVGKALDRIRAQPGAATEVYPTVRQADIRSPLPLRGVLPHRPGSNCRDRRLSQPT